MSLFAKGFRYQCFTDLQKVGIQRKRSKPTVIHVKWIKLSQIQKFRRLAPRTIVNKANYMSALLLGAHVLQLRNCQPSQWPEAKAPTSTVIYNNHNVTFRKGI
jgi:hypothetical protein